MKIRVNMELPDGHIFRETIIIPSHWDDDDKDELTWKWVEDIADVWWEDIND